MLPLVVLAGVAMLAAIAFVILGGSGGGSSSVTPSAEQLGEHRRGRNDGPGAHARSNTVQRRRRDRRAEPPSTRRAAPTTRSRCSPPRSRPKPRRPAPRAPAPRQSSGSSSSAAPRAPNPRAAPRAANPRAARPNPAARAVGSGKHSGGSKPSKPKTVYQVSVLFGEAAAGSSSEGGAGLKPYENLALLTPLPSKARAPRGLPGRQRRRQDGDLHGRGGNHPAGPGEVPAERLRSARRSSCGPARTSSCSTSNPAPRTSRATNCGSSASPPRRPRRPPRRASTATSRRPGWKCCAGRTWSRSPASA